MASSGIGERLRNARTARGLSLEDIEAATRIRCRYLEALEREAWDELPGAAYAKGFLSSYAKQLGLPPDEIVGLFSLAPTLGVAVSAPVDVRITPATPYSRLRRIVTAIVVVFLAGGVFLAYVLYVNLRQFAATRPRPAVVTPVQGGARAPAAPSSAQPSKAAPTNTAPAPANGRAAAPSGAAVTPTSGAPGAASTSPPPGAPTGSAGQTGTVRGQSVAVSVQATDRSWLRVVADGNVVFEGFVSAGDHQAWQGRHQVTLRIGNASALDISVNGQPLGRLGNPGDVVDRTFTVAAPAGAPVAPPAAAPGAPPSPPPAAAPAAPAGPPPVPSPGSSSGNK